MYQRIFLLFYVRLVFKRKIGNSFMPLNIISVTRWLDHFINIWPFTKIKIYPTSIIFWQSRLKILPNWANFAKSGHTGCNKTQTWWITLSISTGTMKSALLIGWNRWKKRIRLAEAKYHQNSIKFRFRFLSNCWNLLPFEGSEVFAVS